MLRVYYKKMRCHVWHVHRCGVWCASMCGWTSACSQYMRHQNVQCSAVCICLLKLAECLQRVMVMQDMQKKASRSTHGFRDEWGVTAAAQVDRASARAGGAVLLSNVDELYRIIIRCRVIIELETAVSGAVAKAGCQIHCDRPKRRKLKCNLERVVNGCVSSMQNATRGGKLILKPGSRASCQAENQHEAYEHTVRDPVHTPAPAPAGERRRSAGQRCPCCCVRGSLEVAVRGSVVLWLSVDVDAVRARR